MGDIEREKNGFLLIKHYFSILEIIYILNPFLNNGLWQQFLI
jgi:hypothetical protein